MWPQMKNIFIFEINSKPLSGPTYLKTKFYHIHKILNNEQTYRTFRQKEK